LDLAHTDTEEGSPLRAFLGPSATIQATVQFAPNRPNCCDVSAHILSLHTRIKGQLQGN